MDGLKTREGYVNVAPICLLYVNKSQQLVPIAIQLKQGVSEEEKTNNPIFLPSDNWIDWLLAKIYYQSAHSQVWNTYVASNGHLLSTNFADSSSLHSLYFLSCYHGGICYGHQTKPSESTPNIQAPSTTLSLHYGHQYSCSSYSH